MQTLHKNAFQYLRVLVYQVNMYGMRLLEFNSQDTSWIKRML